ncbi:MAG TPA: DUF6283 family protein [Reyranella sp.]|nr:DUF6283 family protein [Reyranella sp.]
MVPCSECPFVADVAPFLHPERVRQILEGLRRGEHFICHKTIDYTRPEGAPDQGRKVCAGMVLLMQKEGGLANVQIVQLAERLLAQSFDGVHEQKRHPVYASAKAMQASHDKPRTRPPRRKRARR